MKIGILHHPHTDLSKSAYLIMHLTRLWQQEGYAVGHFSKITPVLLSADVIVLHIDLTCLPVEYTQALASHPRVINRHITDISKNRFSNILLNAEDSYTGRVIIKTRYNYGGLPERKVRELEGSNELPITTPVDWAATPWLTEYPVLPSLQDIPPSVWQNPHLIVEKFLPEQNAEDQYQLREWIFFGDSDVHYMNVSIAPVIKSHTTIRRETLPLSAIPEKLRAIRARLNIDYAKFDYAIHNGEVILYDINKTIGAPGSTLSDPEISKAVLHLSQGINHYMNEKTP